MQLIQYTNELYLDVDAVRDKLKGRDKYEVLLLVVAVLLVDAVAESRLSSLSFTGTTDHTRIVLSCEPENIIFQNQQKKETKKPKNVKKKIIETSCIKPTPLQTANDVTANVDPVSYTHLTLPTICSV